MDNLNSFFEAALGQPDRAMTFMVSRRLAELYPDQKVLEVGVRFDIDGYVRYGQGEAKLVRTFANQECAKWNPERREIRRVLRVSWVEVAWKGRRFQVLRAPLDCGRITWVVGHDSAIDGFVEAVLRFTWQRSPATHVYTGWWYESEPIDRAIQSSRWDELVLPPAIEELMEAQAIGFFDSKAEYDLLGVSWKRGLLLTGPPGNGKTHLIRALLNRLQVPRLIVKSFGDDPDDVQDVFDRVRDMAPCVLVLEDIDSLIPEALLSTVLNALDGAEPLNGVLIVATTNHPERLDPAIRNRPSRFDRVIEFGPPALRERRCLLRALLSRGDRRMCPTQGQLTRLAELTDGFSYAYLKELAVSASVAWLHGDRSEPVASIARAMIAELRGQMESLSESACVTP